MKLFDGLHGFESILLVLGILLFVVLIVALVIFVLRGRSLKSIIPLFVIGAVMIAFPGIEKIRFSKDLVEIERKATELQRSGGSANERGTSH